MAAHVGEQADVGRAGNSEHVEGDGGTVPVATGSALRPGLDVSQEDQGMELGEPALERRLHRVVAHVPLKSRSTGHAQGMRHGAEQQDGQEQDSHAQQRKAAERRRLAISAPRRG